MKLPRTDPSPPRFVPGAGELDALEQAVLGLAAPFPALDTFTPRAINPNHLAPVDRQLAPYHIALQQAAAQSFQGPPQASRRPKDLHNFDTASIHVLKDHNLNIQQVMPLGPHTVVFAQHPGTRDDMQDRHDLWSSALPQVSPPWDVHERGLDCHLFGLFDGHGEYGIEVAEIGGKIAMRHLHSALTGLRREALTDPDMLVQAIGKRFTAVDGSAPIHDELRAQLGEERLRRSGTTVLMTAVLGSRLIVVCLGDSHGILIGEGGRYLPLSRKHQPWCPLEAQRVNDAGGRINPGRSGRVPRIAVSGSPMHGIAVSRVLGDLDAQGMGREPDISIVDLPVFQASYGTPTLVLGTDGIFDALDDATVAALARPLSQQSDTLSVAERHEELANTSARIITAAYAACPGDNTTLCIATLGSSDTSK